MPKPFQIGAATVFHGDCVALLPTVGPVDAIVTDPPYHLTSVAVGWHRMPAGRGTPRITDASVGFMGKAWDGGDIAFRPETWAAVGAALKPGGFLLAFGGSRTHHRMWCAIEDAGFVIQDTIMWLYGQGFPKGRTQLKPAFEPISVAYKPGGKRELQIDDCRVGMMTAAEVARSGMSTGGMFDLNPRSWKDERAPPKGRWPANVCHSGDDEVMAAFAAFGDRGGGKASGYNWEPSFQDNPVHIARNIKSGAHFGDTGTAARFFYAAKAGKPDRAGSKHPTVKPIALMRWLVRLVTPPGGVVLDPFAGSGTTGAAALAEGRRVILVEREAEYILDIKRRLKAMRRQTAQAA